MPAVEEGEGHLSFACHLSRTLVDLHVQPGQGELINRSHICFDEIFD